MTMGLKKTLKNIMYYLLEKIYPGQTIPSNYTFRKLVFCAFTQKILGFNRSVPWPVHYTSKIISPRHIQQGSRFPGFAIQCYLDARNGIILGENVLIGPKVSIVSMNHNLLNYNQFDEAKPVVIGKDSWLAAGCIILPEVELGPHTIVGAGAVVTKSFPEGNQVIAGNPAKVVKKIPAYFEE